MPLSCNLQMVCLTIKYQWINFWIITSRRYSLGKIRLEAYTERSESNPGQGLGTKHIGQMAVWKTVPYECRI